MSCPTDLFIIVNGRFGKAIYILHSIALSPVTALLHHPDHPDATPDPEAWGEGDQDGDADDRVLPGRVDALRHLRHLRAHGLQPPPWQSLQRATYHLGQDLLIHEPTRLRLAQPSGNIGCEKEKNTIFFMQSAADVEISYDHWSQSS